MNRTETRIRDFEDGSKGLSIVDVQVTKDGNQIEEVEVEQYAELDRTDGFRFSGRPEFFGVTSDWTGLGKEVVGEESIYGDRHYRIPGATVTQVFKRDWEADNGKVKFKPMEAPTIGTTGYGGLSVSELREYIARLQHALEIAEAFDNDTGKVVTWPSE